MTKEQRANQTRERISSERDLHEGKGMKKGRVMAHDALGYELFLAFFKQFFPGGTFERMLPVRGTFA